MTPDTIERGLFLAHPVERVWRAVTEELGSWFPDRAELDLRPGGNGTFTFDVEDKTIVAPILVEAYEPTSRFAFWWGSGDRFDAEHRTLVDFTLEPAEGGTRLRVVESGFATLEDGEAQRTGNLEGWEQELGELVAYLG